MPSASAYEQQVVEPLPIDRVYSGPGSRTKLAEELERLEVRRALLLTGRTHQLRVHFAYIGHAVAGDETYSGQPLAGLNRQFLHSYSLRLRSPYDDQEHTFVAELPTDLAEPLERLRRRFMGTRNATRRTR